MSIRYRSLAILIACLAGALTGCHPIDFYTPKLQSPLPSGLDPPTELSKVQLPAYRIGPKDTLKLDVLRLVPRPPYRIGPGDQLQIMGLPWVREQPPEAFTVQDEGQVALGPEYGQLRVEGLTVEEAQNEIVKLLSVTYIKPTVSVQVGHTASIKLLSAPYLVAPDGTLTLYRYGSVRLAGKTITEACQALKKQLAEYFDRIDLSVTVDAYNSQSYYVVLAGAGTGDTIHRYSITGNETVLDALGQVGTFRNVSAKTMWVARPAPAGANGEQILPVDWEAIARGGATATNYQLLPGDRLYVVDDNLIAANVFIGKLVNPFERMINAMDLGIKTIQSTQTMGRDYNRNRSGI